jgi:hypothetical protein
LVCWGIFLCGEKKRSPFQLIPLERDDGHGETKGVRNEKEESEMMVKMRKKRMRKRENPAAALAMEKRREREKEMKVYFN